MSNKRRVGSDSQRIEKFLERADRALESRIYKLTDPTDAGFSLQFTLSQHPDGSSEFNLHLPDISTELVESAVVRCRPFILPSEDNYLPGVMEALIRLAPPTWVPLLELLQGDIQRTVVGDKLMSTAVMIQAWTSSDMTDATDLMSNGEIAMHYIYGDTVHQDEYRRQVLRSQPESMIRLCVVMSLNHLLKLVGALRHVIGRVCRNGDLTISYSFDRDEVTFDPPPAASQMAEWNQKIAETQGG